MSKIPQYLTALTLAAMTPEQLIKKFTTLAEWAGMIQEECFNARKVLERVNVPAPKGGKKKRGLSDAEMARFRIKAERSVRKIMSH